MSSAPISNDFAESDSVGEAPGGWNDAAIIPSTNYDYYNAVVAKMSGKSRDCVRLFVIFGVGRCPGGNGASTLDIDSLNLLDQ